jgi:hypothetical protein
MTTPPLGPIGFRLAHELEGLLRGISADRQILPEEVDRLRSWLSSAEPYRDIRPFSEIRAHLIRALDDGVLSIDECEDLLFVASKYTTVNPYFTALTSGIQVLMGFLTGIAADRHIADEEIEVLRQWIDDWAHLKGLWPYDECESIVVTIVTTREREPGLSHLQTIVAHCPIAGEAPDEQVFGLATAVCATDPVVEFQDRLFVVTGDSSRASRAEIERHIEARGGLIRNGVSVKTDYLIVCDAGSPHWAFACYGRKIDQASRLRKAGHRITIAHERDFWDAIA